MKTVLDVKTIIYSREKLDAVRVGIFLRNILSVSFYYLISISNHSFKETIYRFIFGTLTLVACHHNLHCFNVNAKSCVCSKHNLNLSDLKFINDTGGDIFLFYSKPPRRDFILYYT